MTQMWSARGEDDAKNCTHSTGNCVSKGMRSSDSQSTCGSKEDFGAKSRLTAGKTTHILNPFCDILMAQIVACTEQRAETIALSLARPHVLRRRPRVGHVTFTMCAAVDAFWNLRRYTFM